MKPIDDFVMSTIAEICNLAPEAITPTTNLTDIGFDSLTAVSFVSTVETAYGLELDNEALVELFGATTAAEVIAFVERVRDYPRVLAPTTLPITD